MTDKNEMPDEIYAALGKDGGTYWVRERHEALDKSDAMPQTRYLRADTSASLPVDDLAKVREKLNSIRSMQLLDDAGCIGNEHEYLMLDEALTILDRMGGK